MNEISRHRPDNYLCFTVAARDIAIKVTHTNDTIVLICSADGNPPPVYRWSDSTSNFISNAASIVLKIDCHREPTTLTCAAVGFSDVSITENITVNWTYSACGIVGKRKSISVTVTHFIMAIVKMEWVDDL